MNCIACEMPSLRPMAVRFEVEKEGKVLYPAITPDEIIQKVCRYYDLTESSVKSKSRKRELVMARFVSMYYIRKKTRLSLKTIASHFQGDFGKLQKDHTSVIHSLVTLNDLMDTDGEIRRQVWEIGRLI